MTWGEALTTVTTDGFKLRLITNRIISRDTTVIYVVSVHSQHTLATQHNPPVHLRAHWSYLHPALNDEHAR